MDARDQHWMGIAMTLAQGQKGATAPNPTVGCVIVRGAILLAQAATGAGGRPHAEEQALAACMARGADVFVTLEPCDRRSAGGSSCTDLLVSAQPSRVVVGCRDPHPLANGAGLRRLAEAGIAVEIWDLPEALALNADFFATMPKS